MLCIHDSLLKLAGMPAKCNTKEVERYRKHDTCFDLLLGAKFIGRKCNNDNNNNLREI